MLDEYTEEFGTGLSNPLEDVPVEDPPPAQTQTNNKKNPFQKIRSNPTGQATQTPPQPQYQQINIPQPQPIYQQYIYPNAPEPQPQPAPYMPRPNPYHPHYSQTPPPTGRDRISNIFSEESKELNELLRSEEGGCFKNLVFVFTCILIMVVSFWASYVIGSKLFLPEGRKAPGLFPDFKRGKKFIEQLKDKALFSNEVVKSKEAFQKPEIKLNPGTPILPPEIQQRPPETKPMKVQKATITPKPQPQPKTEEPLKAVVPVPGSVIYRVIVGSFETKEQAQDVISNIKADGFPVFMYKIDGKYRLQIGAFRDKERATALMKKASDYGYNAFISIK